MFAKFDEKEMWSEVGVARQRLFDLLLGLAEPDWNRQSLCGDWQVRSVVAHLIILYHYAPSTLSIGLLRAGLRFNQFLSQTAQQHGQRPTNLLLDEMQRLVTDRSVPFFVPPGNVLVDTLVHEQDIAVPLGLTVNIPPTTLELLFTHWLPGTWNFGERITKLPARTAGIRFEATDIEASYGSGLLVQGRAQDMLMAIVGRGVVLSELHGPGVRLLAHRLGPARFS
jgi:uncharacterized protein (TIGR03083 family)